MPQTIILASIGPVQDFIAAARRCQDLWFGSWLLSDLSKAFARAVMEQVPGPAPHEAIVFPGATSAQALRAGSDELVANKILARVPTDLAGAAQIAKEARESMRGRLAWLRDTIFDKIGVNDPERASNFLLDRANAQVLDLIECHYVCVEEDAAGYEPARKKAESLLAARKVTRTFSPVTWADAVPKSSIDGLRESVLLERVYDRPAEWLRTRYGLRPHERLCGVGLLKRWGDELDVRRKMIHHRFSSTSHAAALPFLVGLAARLRKEPEGDLARRLAEFRQTVEHTLGDVGRQALESAPRALDGVGHIDGELLFESRINELAQEAGTAGTDAVARVQHSLRRLIAAAGIRPSAPIPYYAILLADGDRMGAAISALGDFDKHRELSIRLASFAGTVQEIVEGHLGSLVYSGGDDVLALLPLHTVLACADDLRTGFAARLEAFPGKPTLSVGVAICHHIEDLGAGLELARNAEKLAKRTRNALAIIVDKRGGAPLAVDGSWARAPDDPTDLPIQERLALFRDMYLDGSISAKAGFELAELGWTVAVDAPGSRIDAATLDTILDAEARRILARKNEAGGKSALGARVRDLLDKLTMNRPDRIGRELVVARLLADAWAQAQPEDAR